MFTFRCSVLTFLRIIGETIQDKAVGMEIVKDFFLCYVCTVKDKHRIIRELIADTKNPTQ